MSGQKDYSKKIFTIPNVISMFRLLLIPVFIWSYLIIENYLFAVILLAVSGISDIVDGFIARRFNMVSDVGKVLDPVADKFTQFAIITCLIFKFNYMIIPFIFLLIKEASDVITGIAVIKTTKTVNGAEWHGKLATVFIYTMMVAHIIWPLFTGGDQILPTVSVILVAAATVTTILSFILYTVKNIKLIKAGKKENGEIKRNK
ncbi:MAG: CDP-alcohol phosphatidyltransferase family protein [Clostridia bacterium]|nr:CDP-alcohol phosphatidyltransferase family protein [Clostridia bacterium]